MPENTEIKDSDLAEVLLNMSNSFKSEQDTRNKSEIEQALTEFVTLPTANDLNRYFYSNRRIEKSVIRNLLKRESSSSLYESEMIYQHYDFFKNHLRLKVAEYEGGACSVDKLSRILNFYVLNNISVANNKETIFDRIEEEKFGKWNLPQLGSLQLWFNYVKALISMYQGHVDEYADAVFQLDKFYENHEFVEQGA